MTSENFPDGKSRLAVTTFKYSTNDKPPMHVEKVMPILWNPDNAKTKDKMTYSFIWQTKFKKKCGKSISGRKQTVEAKKREDLTMANFVAKFES